MKSATPTQCSGRAGLATALAIALASLSTPSAVRAQVSENRSVSRSRVIRTEITPALRLSVRRGLDWIVAEEKRTSSFRTDERPVAACALAGLAILTGGYSPDVGPEKMTQALRRITESLLRYQDEKTGYFDDVNKSLMYGHGFATLFLAQLYGTGSGDSKTIRRALERAIQLIERSQTKEGAWDYAPTSSSLFAQGGDTSIAVCQTLALRAASNLGLTVDKGTIALAKQYITRAQRSDGGFAYRMSGPARFTSSAFPRSAAGVCILYSLGDYSSSSLRKGLDYLEARSRYKNDLFPHYAHYYCSQAFFQVGGRRWREYFEWVRETLIRYQLADGSWKRSRSEPSAVVRTGMALIVLQLPYRFLPIHER